MNRKLWLWLGIALVCSTLSAKAHAQDMTLKCESNDGHLKQCSAPGARRVTLVRQISGTPCVEGRTWGYRNDTVWVDGGCRAEFRVQTAGNVFGGGPIFGGGGGQYGNGQVISCSSDDEHRHFCRVDTRGGVTLTRQVSGSPCVQGQTWGYTADGIWVDRGCRAEFQVGRNSGGYWPGQGGSNSSAGTIHCASDDEHRHVCRVDTQGGVQMVRQASGSPCIEGQTWGYTRDAIWVDRGCRADFQVGAYGNSGGYWPGQGNGGSNWPGQGNGGYGQGRQTVYCASDDGGRHYCTGDMSGVRRVRLVNQRSGSPCIEGQTWGYDQRGIWVDRGCRAEFSIRGGGRRNRYRDNDRDDNYNRY